ncbi:hypothetical protein R1flu_010616 [Riccia fluitans]|uniref:Myb-like domain-containing protein n=1 Tax=Riccia fluitans TaxID=41844 RepID=A0ABD1Z6J1_9MARC
MGRNSGNRGQTWCSCEIPWNYSRTKALSRNRCCVRITMIGQQKRSLEHSVSPHPTKYQKHYDDNFCETSAKVASPTGVQFDIEEFFSGVQPKDSPSRAATSFDSSRSVGKVVELGSSERRRLKLSSDEDQEEKCESVQELEAPADLSAGLEARHSASLTCRANCREGEVDQCTESETLSAELGSHSEERIDPLNQFCADNSEHPELNSAEDLCCFRGGCSPKNTLDHSFSRSGSVECGVPCQTDGGPSRTDASEMTLEGDHAFLESVRKTVESRQTNGSRPLPVFLSAQARIGDFARESRLEVGEHEKPSPLVGEQFAESEPCFEKSDRGTTRGDNTKQKGVCHHISRLFGNEAEMQIVSEEKETGVIHSYGPCRQRSQRSAALGEVWEETQAQSSDREPPTMYADTSVPTIDSEREFEPEDGRNSEELERESIHLLGRNHQPLINTLIWIKRMALDPGNPHMGEGVEGTGQNAEWVKDCGSQAEKIRGVFWRKKETKVGEGHQAKQLPSPSHYYEELPRSDQQSIERFRVTRERVAQYGYPGSPGLHKAFHEASNYLQRGSSPQNHWSNHRLPRSFHSSYTETGYPDFGFSDRPRKRIPVGPDFQADVPLRRFTDENPACERAGVGKDENHSSDEDNEESARWFGKQVWPPPECMPASFPDLPAGVGRSLTCACIYPGSVDCVRVHIQEERVRLERELGQAFYIWKFDEIGESVADTWTREEERRFKAVVKLNPPSNDKNFWEQLPDAFPGKKMRDLVSYYFNVFVLRRRAVQNRLDGRQADSDDDETELPEADSDESEEEEEDEEYDSGEEPDEDAEEDTSDAEYETDHQNDSYGGGRSEKHAGFDEHAVFYDLTGVNLRYCATNMETMDTDVDVDSMSVDICTSSAINFQTEDQDFRSARLETVERDVQLTPNWSHVQVEKHLETHASLIGEEELQEVKTWEDPHWDEADHHREVSEEDGLVDPPLSGQPDSRVMSSSRNASNYTGAGFGEDPRNTLACEGGVWGGPMDGSPREGDKLLSTNGMILELFGDESPQSGSPS